ncbi:MAG: hypothetical protein LE178_02635 [Endomicrobium sp.]|nr:hypothetical protein [Endomicrobium sp.]
MGTKMKIKELTNTEILKLKESGDFISLNEIDASEKLTYSSVSDGVENNTFAIFDLRDSVDCVKQMRIYYSKSLAVPTKDKNTTEREIEDNVELVMSVLVNIFSYLKTKTIETGRVKIYANTQLEFMVFSLMAQEMQKKDEDKHDIKLYKRWIEIIER